MKISNFNDTLLYSNKNLEKIASKLVNSSSNAVLMEMFSDECLLADHETGAIYKANYSFDGKKIVFENFESIELEEDDSSLREAISDYFDDNNINLVESYENKTNETDLFDSSLTEALASKNMKDVIDYSSLVGINEEIEELKNTEAYKVFSERLEKYPLNTAKYFDWVSPVSISLIDEDNQTVASKSAIQRAKKLKSDTEFKNSLVEAITMMNEGDNTAIEDLLSENICLLSLNESEMKELVGIAIIGDKELVENRKNICNQIDSIIEDDEFFSAKRDEFKNLSEESSDEELPEINEEEASKFIEALKFAESKVSNDDLSEKINDIIDEIEEAANNGETNISAVKEAISILSL